ncbi:MAG: hypothetical protein HY671_10090 [Chloroflexi bacterium]|nr:hypothetical protein [Chloroflexota bacterium]
MRRNTAQIDLFGEATDKPSLPTNYRPLRPAHFDVFRIYLASGSLATPERRRFVRGICSLYPEAKVVECLDTPHNRIQLDGADALELHKLGKHTLVLGELKVAVRFSQEKGNACPNYWHFSPSGFCPYGCKYCYLAGTQGVKFSPTVKVYVNLPEILWEIDRISGSLGRPTAFYLGKLQDGLALDPLTAYSTVMVPFFAHHSLVRLTLLTKSAHVERLLELEHRGHTILSWSVNPPEVAAIFEENVPNMTERLEAMKLVAAKGYPVRAVMMPIVPIEGWEDLYLAFTECLLKTVPIQRLTLGGVCIYSGARRLMEQKIGPYNAISSNIDGNLNKAGDGRERYSEALRHRAYSIIVEAARRLSPDVELALCLEDKALWQRTGLGSHVGRCNCVL